MSDSTPQMAEKKQSFWQRWVAYLSAPIDGASLGVYRIVFGITFAVYVACYFFIPDIHEQFVKPRFFFSYIPFIQPLPAVGLYAVYACNFVCSVLIALGLFYRPAAILFFLGSTYIFLLDRSLFLNHEYLACLTALLMALAPANNNYSLDRRFEPEKFPTTSIPRWNLLIIKCQLVIVYWYGALWKLNPDWLQGIPCEQFMTCNKGLKFFAPFSYDPLFPKFLALGGILVDSLVPVFLIIPQMFWFAVALAVPFHCMNMVLFTIGVFPFYMMGTLLLFPPHNWPRKWIAKFKSAKATAHNVTGQLAPLPPAAVKSSRLGTVVMLVFFHVYLLIQITLPLRHLAYSGNVDWTEEGYYFAWRMMLHQKFSDISMYATNPKTGKRRVIPVEKILNRRQIQNMSRRPELAHHFAEWFANEIEKRTGVRPIVTAKCIASLHNRPWRDLIDPRVDLAAQPFNLAQKSWIMPLDCEIESLPNYQQRDWYNEMAKTGDMVKARLTSVGLKAF
jgi:Vitamin K-dependent gamma-carboxylase.